MIPIPTTLYGWAMLGTAIILIVLASRRRPWHGATPALWWREQRMHRRPAAIWRRTGRVALAALLILAATLAGLGIVLTLVVAGAVVVGLAALWYWAHRGAIRVEPTTTPVEDGRAEFLLALGDGPFDVRVVDGDVELVPDPDTPYSTQHHRPETDQ